MIARHTENAPDTLACAPPPTPYGRGGRAGGSRPEEKFPDFCWHGGRAPGNCEESVPPCRPLCWENCR
jgi:hypothetical protein